ncbi:prominin-2 [Spea bombifrons]|uniref:prominin-2 n=1 Tax=Spea bombifrons TaxID=233779 RepID=UPI00234ADB26|nr:prominin-2 [Spea bombifrons]
MGSLNIRRGAMDPIVCCIFCIFLYNMGKVDSQQCQSTSSMVQLLFEEVETSKISPAPSRDWGALSPLFRMDRLFLDAVQPNPFPEDILRVAFRNSSSLKTSEVIKYEAGYVICAVIAVLFIIFMLVLGIFYCVAESRRRRIFETCDGVICQPWPIFTALVITCCILFAGLVCSFYLNEKVHQEVRTGTEDFSRTLEDFRSSINSIPQAIEKVTSEFSVPKLKVYEELEKFGVAIGRLANSKLNDEIYPILQNGLQTAKQLERAIQLIVDVNVTMAKLQQGQSAVVQQLNTHRQTLQRVLSDPLCENCSQLAGNLQTLELSLNYSQIPSVEEYLNKLSNVRRINMSGIFQQGFQALNEVPKLVNSQTSRTINDAKMTLDRTEQEIKSYVTRIPIRQYTDPINTSLINFKETSTTYEKEVERYENYRWVVAIVLLCVILLIVACTFLGLLIGLYGLYVDKDPLDSTLKRRPGFILLKVEVYLSFIFSWLLIILVFITFLVGGNMQTLVCKNWANGNIYRFLDNPENLPPNVNLRAQLGLRENASITDLYEQCKRGAPIWDIIQMNTIDLDSAFNITRYTSDLQSKIDSLTVDVEGLDLFTNIAILLLSEYKDAGLGQVPVTNITSRIQTPSLTMNIAQFAGALGSLAANQRDPTIRSELQNKSTSLRGSSVRELELDTRKLNDSLRSLAELTPTLPSAIDSAIQGVQTLQGPLVRNTIELLKNEGRCLFNQSIGYFVQYMDWVKRMVTQEISSCRSVPQTLDRARIILCDNVTDPWNGFWFCLGWCTFFLIPNVIFSIKSSEHIMPLESRFRGLLPEEENLFQMTEYPAPERNHVLWI